ncbi:MAG: hypothetical protein K2X93_24365 [Candidatus Obscuribacterales bacterium]|nr:hypothetical protein [Candidatus Obscuribacterales bacterium]
MLKSSSGRDAIAMRDLELRRNSIILEKRIAKSTGFRVEITQCRDSCSSLLTESRKGIMRLMLSKSRACIKVIVLTLVPSDQCDHDDDKNRQKSDEHEGVRMPKQRVEVKYMAHK